MIFKKTHTLQFNNNEIFRLAHSKNTIIVNHDYKGIDLFDDSLNILQHLPIAYSFTAWAIYKKYDYNVIMIHDPTNQQKYPFTIIDLDSLEIKTCNPGPLANQCFTKNYYWKDDTVILIAEET